MRGGAPKPGTDPSTPEPVPYRLNAGTAAERQIPEIQFVVSEELSDTSSKENIDRIILRVSADLDQYFQTQHGEGSLSALRSEDTSSSTISQLRELADLANLSETANRHLPEGTRLVIYLEPNYTSPGGEYAEAWAVNATGEGSASVLRLNPDYRSGIANSNATLLYREVARGAALAIGAGPLNDLTALENGIRQQLGLPKLIDPEAQSPVETRPVSDRVGFEAEYGAIRVEDGRSLEVGTLAQTSSNELGFPLLELANDVAPLGKDLEIRTGPVSFGKNQDPIAFQVRQILDEQIKSLTEQPTTLADFVKDFNDRLSGLGEGAEKYRLEVIDGFEETTLKLALEQVPNRLLGGAVQVNVSIPYDALGDPLGGVDELFLEDGSGVFFIRARKAGIEVASNQVRTAGLSGSPSPTLEAFFTHFVYTGILAVNPATNPAQDGFLTLNKAKVPLLLRVSLEDVVTGILSPDDIAVLNSLNGDAKVQLRETLKGKIREALRLPESETNFDGFDDRFDSIFEDALAARNKVGRPFQLPPSLSNVSGVDGRSLISHTHFNLSCDLLKKI